MMVEILSFIFENVASQYNTGGYRETKVDIDIDNGKFGIELKLAKSLINNTSEIFRLIGQVIYYRRKLYYYNNFLIAIAGTDKEINFPIMIELFEILKDLNIDFVILRIV